MAAAAAPRLVSADYPRGSRGAAAIHRRTIRAANGLAGRELDRPHERVALVLELRADDALDHQVQVLSRFAGAANYIVRRVRDASADLAEAPRVRRRGARPPPEEALQGGRVGVFGLGLGPVGARLAVEPPAREPAPRTRIFRTTPRHENVRLKEGAAAFGSRPESRENANA